MVLAGGESRRMAVPKAFIRLGGMTVIERELRVLSAVFDEVLIVANDPGPFLETGVRIVPDVEQFRIIKGPMTGVYSGLSAARHACSFVVGCDMPFIKPELTVFLAGLSPGHDIVIPRVGLYAEAVLHHDDHAVGFDRRR